MYVKNPPPPDQPAGQIGHNAQSVQIQKDFDAVRGGMISLVEASVAAGALDFGSGLGGLAVLESPFPMYRRIQE